MLKFINHHLDTIAGIGIYPAISFVLFFGFFLAVLFLLKKTSRTHVDHMASLPLTSGTDPMDPTCHEH